MTEKDIDKHAQAMLTRHRGFKQVRLGGRTHSLRFRAFEIAELEKQLKSPITKILQEQNFGMDFAICAVMVGTAHAYAGKTGKEARMSRQKVAGWIDKVDDYGALMGILVEAVVLGLPGAKTAADEAKADAEGDDETDPLDVESPVVASTDSSTGTPPPSAPSAADSPSTTSGETPSTSTQDSPSAN